MKQISLFLFIFMSFQVFAVYNPGGYGQKDFDLYYGAMDLSYDSDDYQEQVIFKETEVYKNYADFLIQSDFVEFEKFFSKSLLSSLSCPTSEITEMYHYLQYANRVLAISYLYEELEANYKTAKKLGENNTCHIDWKKELENCKPKSKDMKFFIKSAKHIVDDNKEVLIPVSHSIKLFQREWIKQFINNDFKEISHYRLGLECNGNMSCSKYMDYKSGVKVLGESCDKDRKLFNSICSENDHLYGMSDIQETYPLIVNSDILTVVNEEGFAAGCLRRFKSQTKRKELKSKVLETIFPITYYSLIENKSRYLQGRLFPAGSLKQFTEKGLISLYKEEEPKAVIIPKAPEEKTIINTKVDKVELIDKFVKVKKKKKKEVKPKPIEKKKPQIKKSSFLVAVELLSQENTEEVKVDMLKFKYDFLFSIPLKKLLDDNLQMYISRSGLEQMKKFDSLGSKKGAIPLMFLKYLIETEKHQALYNLKSIIGDQFYVNNDIDDKNLKLDMANFIELRNDEQTNWKWQIYIIKEAIEPEVLENK